MPQFPPERVLVEDKLSHGLMFEGIRANVHGFDFAEMLRLWFSNDTNCLLTFLRWLDAHGLEIRKKNRA